MYNQIYDYFVKKDLLSKHQFGFRPFHSTSSTLLDCTNEWFVNMDRGLYNLVVLLDLKKAFDTVNHEILLHKLQIYGFQIKALNFIRDYLTNRTQRCQLNGLYSDQREVTCGIPQGSILSPLLFIIYTRNTRMQQPLALVSKQLYFPNMKYLKIVVTFTLSIFLQKM